MFKNRRGNKLRKISHEGCMRSRSGRIIIKNYLIYDGYSTLFYFVN